MLTALDPVALPPLQALSFLPFLFLQCLLLHPAIPAHYSRPLRFILMFPAAYLGFTAPFRYRIDPLAYAIGANFRWGIFGPYLTLKALEFGLVRDRSPYEWIGFDSVKKEEEKALAGAVAREKRRNSEAAPINPALLRKGGQLVRDNLNGCAVVSGAKANLTIAESRPGLVKRASQLLLATRLTMPGVKLWEGPTLTDAELTCQREDGTIKLVQADIGAAMSGHHLERRQSRELGKGASPITVLLQSLHLFTSFRGVGYAFGPPSTSLPPAPPREALPFFLTISWSLISAHIISTISLIVLIHHESDLPILLSTLPLLSSLSTPTLINITKLLAYFSVGISLHAQMIIGFSGFALIFFLLHQLLHVLPTSLLPISIQKHLPLPFDSREYPPLFDSPFSPTSVTLFWATKWHHLFRKPFLTVGYDPVVRFFKSHFRGGKVIGRALGAFVVFGMSSWMHDQGSLPPSRSPIPCSPFLPIPGLYSARRSLPPLFNPTLHPVPLSFLTRYGAWIFFLSQALAVISEGLFTSLTGNRVGGLGGRIWSLACIIGMGMLAGRSWVALGLVQGLPEVRNWGWERWVVPSAALAPPPLWTVYR